MKVSKMKLAFSAGLLVISALRASLAGAASVEFTEVESVSLYAQSHDNVGLTLSIRGKGIVSGKNGSGADFKTRTPVPVVLENVHVIKIPASASVRIQRNHAMILDLVKGCEKDAQLAMASSKLNFVFMFDDGSWNGQDKCAPGFRCSPLDSAGNPTDENAAVAFNIGGKAYGFVLDPTLDGRPDWGFNLACSIKKK